MARGNREELLNDPAWYHGLTLAERLASPVGSSVEAGAGEQPEGARLWQKWRAQPPFTAGSYFERRLAADGLTEAQFRYLLAEPAAALQTRVGQPAWLAWLAEAYTSFGELPESLPAGVAEALATTFLAAAGPLVHQAYQRLRQGLQELARPGGPFEPEALAAMQVAGLPERLQPLMSRTMVLEMHVARLRGELEGETPAARFQNFVRRLGRPENSLPIWREYPGLARLVVTYLDNWVAANLEFAGRLAGDYPALAATFRPGDVLGQVAGLESHLGDAHQGGRTVTLVIFESGRRLVYKPRSLASNAHFQALLGWLNERGWPLPFCRLRVLERGAYGWVEYAGARPCQTAAEVERFYRRLGAYLALLYALRATDFHYQNVIAEGEQPVLVDLETFFQPPSGERHSHRPEAAAYQALQESVVRIGLLPQQLTSWLDAEPVALDFSGVGGSAGQPFNKAIPQWQGAGTDEMRLGHGREYSQGAQNQPLLQGEPVNPLVHNETLLAGFREMYELLVTEREGLLAPDGPLAEFAGDEMRIVLRATMVYSMLIKDGRHPDLLRNALERERHWDRLWIGIEHRPELERAIVYERHDLGQDDIPLFLIRPGSRDLWSAGGQRIPDFFTETGEALTRKRVLAMGPADLKQQLWFIRAALATLGTRDEQGPVVLDYRPVEAPLAGRAELIAAAGAIGDRLESLAFQRGGEVGWIGLAANGDNWVLSPLGPDLYSGVPGIALFLGYLGAASGQSRYTRLAEAALETARREIESARRWLKLVGAFSGWGGVIYSLTHLGVLWQRPELLDEAEGLAAGLAPLIAADPYSDVMAGAAGGLAALLALYHARPNPATLALAGQCGERLLGQARPMAVGAAWIGPLNPEQALAGFSHGAAGVAWALLRLAQMTGESRFRDGAWAAIAYERSLFSAEAGNWPDLRPLPSGASPFRVAWCHGAAGIGLARLDALAALDEEAEREVKVALATTRREGFGRNHCLCHGDLGNAELLLLAEERLGPGGGDTAVPAQAILDGLRQGGPRCGVPLGLETPGLMNGLAGIGYGLLRLADARRMPSLLLLEPPRRLD